MVLDYAQKFTFFVDFGVTFIAIDFLYSPNHKILDKPFNNLFCRKAK